MPSFCKNYLTSINKSHIFHIEVLIIFSRRKEAIILPRFGVWAELMTPEEIKTAVPHLHKYGLDIAIAFPHDSIDIPHEDLLNELYFSGITTYLWVLMPDDLGYWVHEGNATQFAEKIDHLMEWAKKRNLPMNIAVDMELPLDQMKMLEDGKAVRLAASLIKNLDRTRFHKAQNMFDCLAEKIRLCGGKTISPIPFNLTHELMSGKDIIQDMMQTPIANWDRITPMFYTSLFEKMTGGIFTKEDARWYMYRAMKQFRKTNGSQAGVSLGTIGPGKLGGEEKHGYTERREFMKDVRAAIAGGAEDIFIFNLAGIMKTKNPEAWFRSIKNAKGEIPKRTMKGDLLYHLFSLLGKI